MTNKTYIEYDQIDVTAVSDANYAITEYMPFSEPSAMETYGKYSRAKYATFEKNFTLLDGSFFKFPYDTAEIQYPFWSLHISDEDGLFSVNPTVTATFTIDHSSMGISIYFEEDYPLKAKVTFYNSSDIILSQEEYDINSLIFSTNNKVDDYRKVTIEFTKAKPFRFVKFYYIEYGRTVMFGEDVLKSATLTNDCDPTSDKLAISTLNFQICDRNDDYNLANPDGQHKTFQKNQALKLYREKDGIKSNYGEFYLKDFSFDNNIVSMNSIDIIGLLDKNEFRGKIYTNTPAHVVLSDIMEDANVPGYISMVDEDIRITEINGILKKQSCRSALRELCFRLDCIITEPLHFIEKQSKTVQSTIGRERKFSTQIENNEYVSDVSIKYQNYVLNSATVPIIQGHYLAGTHKIEFTYPVANLSTSAGVIITFETFYCVLYLASESDIIISGNKYDMQEVVVTYSDPYMKDGENKKSLIFNASLMNNEIALAKAKSILEYYQMGLGITTRFANDTEKVGNYAMIANSDANYSDFIAGIESTNTDLIGGWITTATARGYFQQFTDNAYCGEFYCGEDGVL